MAQNKFFTLVAFESFSYSRVFVALYILCFHFADFMRFSERTFSMEFEFIHFPDFQNSFFGKEYRSSILETYSKARKRLSCRHITHITPKHPDDYPGQENVRTVVTTLPADWVVNYSVKSYYDIDPLFHQKWSDPDAAHSVSIAEIYQLKQNTAALQKFVDDMRAHKFGHIHIMVTQRLNGHGDAHTIFVFDNQTDQSGKNSMSATELIRLLEKDFVQVAAQVHDAVLTAISDHSSQKQEVQSLVSLTPREIDCLKWAARGKTDGEIAEILSIARWTVVTYLQNAKIKLGCANRTSAVAVAMSLGIIPLPDTSHLQG